MKSILPFDLSQNLDQRVLGRQLTNTRLRIAGTPRRPSIPRGCRFYAKTATSGLLVWETPVAPSQVTGYRVYRDTEKNLAMEIGDRLTTQAQVDMPVSGTVNFYISAVNGQSESAKIQVQGKLS